MGCIHSTATIATSRPAVTLKHSSTSSSICTVPQCIEDDDCNNGTGVQTTTDVNNMDGSSILRGRVSACSYRSYLSYDELAPDSIFTDRLSLASLTSAVHRPTDIALVTPHGTMYRLSNKTAPKYGAKLGLDECENVLSKCVVGRDRQHSESIFVNEPDVTMSSTPETSVATVFDFTMAAFDKYHKNKVALLDAVTNRFLTFDNMTSLTRQLAAGLFIAGLRPRDRVLVICSHLLELVPLFLGVTACGGQFTLLQSTATEDILLERLRRLNVMFVVMDSNAAGTVRKAARRYGKLKKIYCVSDLDWCEQLASLYNTNEHLFTTQQVTSSTDDVVLLAQSTDIYDSPQIVQLTHSNLIACWSQLRRAKVLRLNASHDVILGLLPADHVFSLLVSSCSSLLQGCTVVCLPGVDTRHMLHAMDTHKVNVIHVLADCVGSVINHPLVKTHPDHSQLTIVVYGTPFIPLKYKKYMRCLGFRDVIYIHGYVETTSIVAITSIDEQCSDDMIGTALYGTQFKVVDHTSGRTVGHHEDGDVYIRGPQVMKLGYLGRSDQQHLVLRDDGWLRTGDTGWLDADGTLFLSARADSLIHFRKFKICPREIENVILRHPGVGHVTVLGVADPSVDNVGHVPRALVVLKQGYSDVTAEQLIDFTNKHVTSHKQLRGGLHVVDSILRSSNGRPITTQPTTKTNKCYQLSVAKNSTN